MQFALLNSKIYLVLYKPKSIPQGRPLPPEILAPNDLPSPDSSDSWHVLPCTSTVRASETRRRETRWNLQGCPKLPDWSQLLVGRSSPYCGNMWRRYCCLTSFFQIVDTCLSWEDIARQSCVMVPRSRFFEDFLCPVDSCKRCQLSLFGGKFISEAQFVWW